MTSPPRHVSKIEVHATPVVPPPPPSSDQPTIVSTSSSLPEHASDRSAGLPWSNPARWLTVAPPWLISLIFHMLVLLILALSFLPQVRDQALKLYLSDAEQLGDQLQYDLTDLTNDSPPLDTPAVTPSDLPIVDDPLLNPPQLPIDPFGQAAPQDSFLPDVGMALQGRTPGMKEVLLSAYGGNAATEAAVLDGLEWLQKNQLATGRWSLSRPYADGARNENVTSATAMALLAFLGAGHTPGDGRFEQTVSRGCRAFIAMQSRDGDFWKGSVQHHRLYSQAQATIAVCELYAMTQDSQYRLAAQKAVDYAVRTQADAGGWRYQPGYDSDTSVTGWFAMGLQSARMAGLEVPRETFDRIGQYLDRVASYGNSRYGYRPGMAATYPMTAEGLLCRQYLGWQRNDARLIDGCNHLMEHPIDFQQQDFYAWYYATQVFHHMGGEFWEQWNEQLRSELPAHQTSEGAESGSWAPHADRWGPHGGRLYTTCMALYMLEVYYRHLPVYDTVHGSF